MKDFTIKDGFKCLLLGMPVIFLYLALRAINFIELPIMLDGYIIATIVVIHYVRRNI